MVIKVGINGFGRIGRVIFRTCHQNDDIELSAINDPAIDVEYICYLIKFDSTHGKFNGIVLRRGDEIQVDDHRIKIFHEKLPLNVPWQEAGVQYVIEASGMFTTLEKASGHLQSDTVRRVIVTAPSVDVPMIILGVNDIKLNLDHKVLSCASSTLYCLATIIKVLEDNFGVAEGFMTSIHAMTPLLKPLDGLCLKGKHWRDHRSIHQNIIPASTGACKALGKIIPDVKDKISGLAFRIPIVNVSVLDLSVRLSKNTTLEDIVNCVAAASNADMKNIIKISNEESVSSDFNGDSHSCILDVNSSIQMNLNFFKLICWYENEHSYACRVVDSILFSERQFYLTRLSPKFGNINTKPCGKINQFKKSDIQKKEMVIDTGKELINLTSRDNASNTIKQQQHRCIVLKKPTSVHNSEPASSNINAQDLKKRNEMFKIWNDTKETPISNLRQKRGSLFHSSVSFPQQNIGTNDCNKAQERLQKVKREFSKMVNITEDLLKKSYSNRIQLGTVVHDSKDVVDPNTKNDIEQENTLTENDYERINKPIFDICGDYKNKIEVKPDKVIDVWNKEEMKTMNNIHENCVSNCSNSQNESIVNFNFTTIQSESELNPNANSTMIEGSCINKNSVSEIVDYTNNSQILKDNTEFKDEVAKTVNTLIDGLAENFQIHAALHEQGDSAIILNSNPNGINKDNETDDVILNNSKVQNIGDNSSSVDILNLDDKDVENTNNEIKDIPTDENVFTHNNTGQEPIDNKAIKICSVKNEQFTKNNDHRKDVLLSKQILERLNRFVPEPIFLIPEDDVRDNTTLNINKIYVKQNKLDIYDKLDSVSASGSENSFEIHGRKSQIIDIADLTNSIDDLANMEKICKIIEISDELSDKLFSTLKKKDCNVINKERWSFKDLCERINLDEFCDKLFGKAI